MITAKDCENGRDPLLEALAKPTHARGIYVRNNATSLADRMTRERIEQESENKLVREMKIASGEIQLDYFGNEVKPVEPPRLRYVNQGRDVLGDLVRGEK